MDKCFFYANELASKTSLLFKDVYYYYVLKLNLLGTFDNLSKQKFALHVVYCKSETR